MAYIDHNISIEDTAQGHLVSFETLKAGGNVEVKNHQEQRTGNVGKLETVATEVYFELED